MTTRVLLHFHPNWPFGGDTVLGAMARDGRYRSQWETGTSNGGLTARVGGDRWRWESRLFGGRYDAVAAAESDRSMARWTTGTPTGARCVSALRICGCDPA